jgi:hypothetical protein
MQCGGPLLTFLCNIGTVIPNYSASHPRRQCTSCKNIVGIMQSFVNAEIGGTKNDHSVLKDYTAWMLGPDVQCV